MLRKLQLISPNHALREQSGRSFCIIVEVDAERQMILCPYFGSICLSWFSQAGTRQHMHSRHDSQPVFMCTFRRGL